MSVPTRLYTLLRPNTTICANLSLCFSSNITVKVGPVHLPAAGDFAVMNSSSSEIAFQIASSNNKSQRRPQRCRLRWAWGAWADGRGSIWRLVCNPSPWLSNPSRRDSDASTSQDSSESLTSGIIGADILGVFISRDQMLTGYAITIAKL